MAGLKDIHQNGASNSILNYDQPTDILFSKAFVGLTQRKTYYFSGVFFILVWFGFSLWKNNVIKLLNFKNHNHKIKLIYCYYSLELGSPQPNGQDLKKIFWLFGWKHFSSEIL